MRDIPFLPAAEAEFLEELDRYAAENPELAADFLAEVEAAAQRAALFPEHGSPFLAGTRRIVLRRFRYSFVYVVEPGTILVVAIAHHRRRPGYWRNRLR